MHIILELMSRRVSWDLSVGKRNMLNQHQHVYYPFTSRNIYNPLGLLLSSHLLNAVSVMGHVKAKIEQLRFEMNFYRVHLIYFLLTIILSSIIMYGSGIKDNSDDAQVQFKLRYIDAIFLCASVKHLFLTIISLFIVVWGPETLSAF